jgi:hypothetical protein
MSIYLLMLLTTPLTSIRLLSKSQGYMNSLTFKSIAKKWMTILRKLPTFEASGQQCNPPLWLDRFASIGDQRIQGTTPMLEARCSIRTTCNNNTTRREIYFLCKWSRFTIRQISAPPSLKNDWHQQKVRQGHTPTLQQEKEFGHALFSKMTSNSYHWLGDKDKTPWTLH